MDIPKSVLDEISIKAAMDWSGDKEMQEYQVKQEMEFYTQVMVMDFLDLSTQKDAMVNDWLSESGRWEEVLDGVRAEISSFLEIKEFDLDFFTEAERALIVGAMAREDLYQDKLWALKDSVETIRNIKRTRRKVEPVKPLLIRLEEIVGNEFYNANIQNYGPGGEWEGEGGSFRYPVTFNIDGEATRKTKSVSSDINAEELVSGRYACGANDLNIYRALVKILDYLRNEYGFDPDSLQKNTKK
ncbi:hypothetical protein JQR88_06105 [Pseudomonas luteola]|uniref:hypothetical protein n=1 Tax=Pseudomonas luteola TaxID=47886 RepID=UPI003DA1B6BC